MQCVSPAGAAFSRSCIQKQAREIRVNAHGTGSCKGEIRSRRGGKSAKLQAGKGADPQHRNILNYLARDRILLIHFLCTDFLVWQFCLFIVTIVNK